jgi:hypothetical protein
MNDFIYEASNSLSSSLCDTILELFSTEIQYPGITSSGHNPEIKDTSDFVIPEKTTKWGKIFNTLMKELNKNLSCYKERFRQKYEFDIIGSKKLFIKNMLVQNYQRNKGRYIFHNDSRIEENSYRIITFLWYLNDVDVGGETEFFGKYKIQPRKGKLILFPANWTFPHCGNVPISIDKTIITGWIYLQVDNSLENNNIIL